ncbi:MAG: hypothetical protein ABIO39_01115 [Caulobacteraceae bacterium]
MVLPISPALRPILLGSLAALVCGSVVALGMLPGKVSERARKAETSATGSQLQIAVTVPVRAPVPAPTGKLETMPEHYAEGGPSAAQPSVALQPTVRTRDRGIADRSDEVFLEDDAKEVAVAPRYARAPARWRNAPQSGVDEGYDEPPATYPPARERYQAYREERRWDDQRFEDRAGPGDRYAPGSYFGERYDPPSWR